MSGVLRSAVRRISANRGAHALAAATLAAAIGASAAVYGVLETVLLRPLPLDDPSHLVAVWESSERSPDAPVEVSWSNFADWRERNRVFSSISLATSVNLDLSLTGQGDPRQVATSLATADFFDTLGARPAEGRTFLPGEDAADAAPVVVLGWGVWQRVFGGDPELVGRTLRVEGQPCTVVGVMPRGFSFPDGAEMWAPLTPPGPSDPDARAFRVYRGFARLAPGVDLAAAEAGMRAVASDLARAYPKEDAGYGVTLVPVLDTIFGSARRALPLLQGAVLLVLGIACVNVAHLQLGIAARARRETAVRAALGASPARLAGEALLEGALVAGVGGLGGVAIAGAGLAVLRRLAPADLPRIGDVRLDAGVLGVAVGLAALAALLSAALPAWRTAREVPGDALRESATNRTSGPGLARLRRGLVVSEVALAALLLVGAGLLVRSLVVLESIDPGWKSRGVWTARVALVRSRYPDRASQVAFFESLLERVRAVPGVSSAAAVLLRPLSGTVGWDYPFTIEGKDASAFASNPYSNFLAVSDGYFGTVGLRLVEGRDFAPTDRAGAPSVVIVGESLARRYWPRESAVGKRLKFGSPGSANPWAEVVGVARDGRYREWGAVRPDVYAPLAQLGVYRSDFVVKSRLDPAAVERAFRDAVASLDPEQAVALPETLDSLVDRALARPRFDALLLASFASLACLLAAAGVYGVLAFSVAGRIPEIGVRMALGASERRIVRAVVVEGLILAGTGAALGLGAAAAAARLLGSLLHDVAPLDPWTYGAAGAGIVVLAVAASLRPARRAARVEPAVVLRES